MFFFQFDELPGMFFFPIWWAYAYLSIGLVVQPPTSFLLIFSSSAPDFIRKKIPLVRTLQYQMWSLAALPMVFWKTLHSRNYSNKNTRCPVRWGGLFWRCFFRLSRMDMLDIYLKFQGGNPQNSKPLAKLGTPNTCTLYGDKPNSYHCFTLVKKARFSF